MKRVDYIILHGCPPNPNDIIPPEKRWMNWLADQLEEKGFKAVAPEMPNSWNPQYEEWKEVMNQYQIDKSTILIGHSCACAFLIKWLLESRKKIKKLVLVAPSKISKRNYDIYDFDLPEDVSDIAEQSFIFISNDEENILKSADLYEKSLKAKVVKLENMRHFHIYAMGRVEFPELLEVVLPK